MLGEEQRDRERERERERDRERERERERGEEKKERESRNRDLSGHERVVGIGKKNVERDGKYMYMNWWN